MSHRCPGPECTITVPDTMLACRRHWYSVPAALRKALWKAYRADDTVKHSELRERCIRAMHEAESVR